MANETPQIDEAQFADMFKRQYLAREARRTEERASRVRELQAAQRQLAAERASRNRQAEDPLLMPEEGSASPQETLVLPSPTPYSMPPSRPSPAARSARVETSPVASDNWGRAAAAADARAAVAATTDPTNPLGLPPADVLSMDIPAPTPKTGLDAMPSPPAHSKAPVQSGRSPVPGWNLPPESGTLPGEEQVTSMDVFKRLSAREQGAIRQQYERGSHADAESFEDYLGFKYGDLPPAKREAAMRADYGSPSDLSPLAQQRRAAGKPLPEGLKPGVYTPEQMRGMSRDIYTPEVPQTYHGGTFTFNADGSMSSRGVEDFRLKDAEKAATYAGEGSFEHNRALGKAYGIDVSQYDGTKPEDQALLAADVAREKERHDRLATKYDTVRTPMGGTRYAANPEKMAKARLDNEAQMSPQRKQEFARTILQRYGRMLSDQDRANISTYIQTPDGFTRLRELNEAKRMELADKGAQSWRDRQANFRMTTDLRNPNLAPGMAVRSLIEAVRSGDPVMLATVNDIAGNPRGAQRAMDLAMGERAGAAALAQAEMLADAKKDKEQDGTIPSQLLPQFMDALRLPPQQRDATLSIIMRKSGVPETEIPARIAAIALEHTAGINPNSEEVKRHLLSLRNDKPAFMQFATQAMKLSEDQAEQMYASASGSWAYSAGQSLRGAPGYAAGGATNFARGVAGYPAPQQ
jgi:hypothetical protein